MSFIPIQIANALEKFNKILYKQWGLGDDVSTIYGYEYMNKLEKSDDFKN